MDMVEQKICISCGMPMREKEEYPAGDTTKDYCVYCAREDGTLKSYDEMKAGMTGFIMRTQGFEREVAEKLAVETMLKQPAWQ